MTIAEKIAALEDDVWEMKRMRGITESLLKRNNEAGDGECMLLAVKVLLREAVMHYEEEIAILSRGQNALMQPPPQPFECGGCGENFQTFREAARHSWTPDKCKPEVQIEVQIIEELVSVGAVGMDSER